MTKQIPRTDFKNHANYIYWRPDFHIQSNNRLDDSYMDTHSYLTLNQIILFIYLLIFYKFGEEVYY